MLVDGALACAARGWPVFPCAVRGKVPLLSREQGGHGLADATTDETRVRAWWAEHPLANVAIVMGRVAGLFALDLDTGKGAMEALAQLEAAHGALPETLTAATGGGGEHRFFRFPAHVEIRNSQGRIAAGIDIRGEGGYVVAAPSVHPSGEPYRWTKWIDPADAPAWLIQLAKPSPAPAAPPLPPPASAPRRADAMTRASAWLATLDGAVSGSGGHQQTWRAALGIVRGFDLDASSALYLLEREYNPRCEPPWPRRDLEHKVASAGRSSLPRGYLLDDPRRAWTAPAWRAQPELVQGPPPDVAAQLAGEVAPDAPDPDSEERAAIAEEPAPPPPRTAVDATWRPLSLSMLTEAPPARRWLLRHPTRDGHECAPGTGDGMLPLGKAGLLVADGGVGKTMALFGLALSVITGRRWLNHFDVGHDARKGRVLLALAEEDIEEVHRRLYACANAYNLDLNETERVLQRLVVLPLAGRAVPLLTYGPDGRTLIESPELLAMRARLLAEPGPDGWSLVALDPLARWAADDTEKDNAIATRTMQAAETLLEVPGRPTVLLAHHASAADVKAGGALRSRGATGIRNGARWEGTLREEGPLVYFRQTKSNYSRPMVDDLPLMRGDGGLLRAASPAEQQAREERQDDRSQARDAEKQATVKAEVVRDIEALIAVFRKYPGGIGVRELKGVLRAEGITWGKDRLTAARTRLEAGHGDVRLLDMGSGQKGMRSMLVLAGWGGA